MVVPLKRNVESELVVAVAVVISQELKYEDIVTTKLERSLEIKK